MKAKITSAFRFTEEGRTRKFTPGQVAEGDAAAFAISQGLGEALEAASEKQASAPANKAKQKPHNK